MDSNSLKESLSEAIQEIIKLLQQAHVEELDNNTVKETTAIVLTEILYKEIEGLDLETRGILADIITENNNTIILTEKDLSLYKMTAKGNA